MRVGKGFSTTGSMHLNNRIGFGTERRKSSSVHRSGIDKNDPLVPFHRRARGVADNGPSQ